MATGDASDPQKNNLIKVNVKFSGRSIPLEISLDSKIKDLKSLLQPLTNVLSRGQKLIFKGKVLVDDMTLRASEVNHGAKIMLMASQGLHQGDGPIKKEAPASSLANTRRAEIFGQKKEKTDVSVQKTQLDRWKATGVIALSQCNLVVIPGEVWTCGSSARVLDLSNNSLQEVPAAIGGLISLQKLHLHANNLLDESVSWEGLAKLKSLTILSLNQNLLTTLPPSIGVVTCLKQLDIANNKLSSLPTEIGLLKGLEILKANNNRISSIPDSIGNCVSLIEVDLSSNLLAKLPETFGELKNLKAIYLSNNGIKYLPNTLFKKCIQLSTVDLHNTEITIELLRELEGWESFDERRRLKHQKQLDFRVTSSAEFDEGADKL